MVLAAAGDPAAGAGLQTHAVEYLRRYFPVPVVLAASLTFLARTLLLDDRPEEALRAAREAVELYSKAHGNDLHSYDAGSLTALGVAQARLGRPDEARATLRCALRTYDATAGPAHLRACAATELSRLPA